MKKIAFPTDDGETISRHLAEAQFYMIAIVDEAGNLTFEKRQKPHYPHDRAAHSAGSHEDHAQWVPVMFTPILDCQVLISGSMGQPASDHALANGLEVILPAQENITDALDAYRDGRLVSDMRRIHRH
ncbi:MAG TPA: NifB/NifX family molybdenum-iron cluster-binding protein [Anaerolineales bacterium]|nr:NifB/NifX family molybdenum-iron cluster-binding protein [Anaerolineales bacterium]